jgi:hypothetical protein
VNAVVPLPVTRHRKLVACVVALGVFLVVALLVQLVLRALFPWDGWMWSESPFMTGMLKLTNGLPVYTSPADANSMLYSAGLEHLTYSLLRPFGLQLDVRACRAVTIAVGFGAAGVSAVFGRALGRELGAGDARWIGWFSFLVFVLVVFHNHTSDALHPDNLYMLHAVAVLTLTRAAIARADLRCALAAVVVASLGVLVKQTAVGSVAGVVFLLGYHFWRPQRARVVGLAAIGLLLTALAAWIQFHDPNARYFTLEMVSRHHIDLYRAKEFIDAVVGVPHRALLFVATVPAAFFLATSERREVRSAFLCWLVVGACEVATSLASFFKVLGTSNSLGILDLWGALLVVPSLVAWFTGEAKTLLVGAAAGLTLLLVSLTPIKATPTSGQRAFGRAIDRKVGADLALGRKVLLAQGVMPFVHNGVTTHVPLDRSSCVWEMWWAGQADRVAMAERVRGHHYDRIYLWVPLYGPELLELIEREYEQVDEIPSDGAQLQQWEIMFATQGFMHAPVRILAPKARPVQ